MNAEFAKNAEDPICIQAAFFSSLPA